LRQRADWRSRSLEASGPQRVIKGTKATASRCRQRSLNIFTLGNDGVRMLAAHEKATNV
jgi:hypothetical protein